MEDITRKFAIVDSKTEMREILSSVYNSLKVKGYDPINQLVGYILSEDPTYITNYNNARSLICRIDRDELMHELLTNYLAAAIDLRTERAGGKFRRRVFLIMTRQSLLLNTEHFPCM